jgi:hypothetical protein
MDLTLYKMAATGRINLTGLVSNREAYYTGERNSETGVVTLTPVRIVSANGRTTDDEIEANDPAA